MFSLRFPPEKTVKIGIFEYLFGNELEYGHKSRNYKDKITLWGIFFQKKFVLSRSEKLI